jgi:hypothetical protein
MNDECDELDRAPTLRRWEVALVGLAAGIATALWLSFVNLAPLRPFRSGRS